MAFSYSEYTGNGSQTTYTFGFTGPDQGYIRSSDIQVLVDGSVVAHSLTSSNTLELSVAPATGSLIRIRRVMPKNNTYTTFSRGNKFGEDNMNNSFLQTLYTVHEFLDGWFPAGFKFLTDVEFSGNMNAGGNDITNANDIYAQNVILGNGLSLEDATNEAYDWANYPVDQPVPAGDGFEYSALHQAIKAQDSANLSESYRNTTLTYLTTTQGYRDTALQYRDEARTARDASQTYRDSSQFYAGNSATSASQALTYRDQAEDAAQDSAGFASNSSASASAASTSASNAASSASAASTSASNADSSASSASTSASTATTQAGLASTARSGAEAARDLAEDYRDEAQAYAASINPSTLMNAGTSTYTGNLNSLTESGTYTFSTTTNAPSGVTSGTIIVTGTKTGVTKSQIAIDPDGYQIRQRSRNSGGTWGPWFAISQSLRIVDGFFATGVGTPYLPFSTLNYFTKLSVEYQFIMKDGLINGQTVTGVAEISVRRLTVANQRYALMEVIAGNTYSYIEFQYSGSSVRLVPRQTGGWTMNPEITGIVGS